MSQHDYDVIIIGSGAGGLAAAVPLAQAGQRVLVCEQHEVPGGWTHSFTLQGYRFSPGVHYIGEVQPGGSLRRVYEGLGVSQDLEFCELNPDGYDHIYIDRGALRFSERQSEPRRPIERSLPQGIRRHRRLLEHGRRPDGKCQLSGPHERPRWISRGRGHAAPDHCLRWFSRSGQDLLDHYISDPVLKGVLSGPVRRSRPAAVASVGVLSRGPDATTISTADIIRAAAALPFHARSCAR